MKRQLAMDFMERTTDQRNIRRAVGEMIAGDRKAGEVWTRYLDQIAPGEITYNGFTAAGEPSGIASIPIDNATHLVRAAGSYKVLDVIAQPLGLVIIEVGSWVSADPCVRELAQRCSEFLAKYHGPRRTEGAMVKAAYEVLKPAAAFTLGRKLNRN